MFSSAVTASLLTGNYTSRLLSWPSYSNKGHALSEWEKDVQNPDLDLSTDSNQASADVLMNKTSQAWISPITCQMSVCFQVVLQVALTLEHVWTKHCTSCAVNWFPRSIVKLPLPSHKPGEAEYLICQWLQQSSPDTRSTRENCLKLSALSRSLHQSSWVGSVVKEMDLLWEPNICYGFIHWALKSIGVHFWLWKLSGNDRLDHRHYYYIYCTLHDIRWKLWDIDGPRKNKTKTNQANKKTKNLKKGNLSWDEHQPGVWESEKLQFLAWQLGADSKRRSIIIDSHFKTAGNFTEFKSIHNNCTEAFFVRNPSGFW